MLPHTHSAGVEAVIVNTAGGITGGDQFDLNVHALKGTSLTLTTQAAERAYRAKPGEIGHIATSLTAQSGATLRWLPQELILFEHCNLHRRLDVYLEQDARFLMVEPVVFGRAAMGETLCDVRFQDRIKISRNGTPIYIDGSNLLGDVQSQLAQPAIAAGAGAMCNVVLVAPEAAQYLETVRAMLPVSGGASLLQSDILVIRLLASDSFEMRRALIPILEHLNQSPLPASWRL